MATTVLAIGDPHFRVDNIAEIDMLTDRLQKLIVDVNPDFVVCLGDLLHTHERIHTIALNKAYDFIKSITKPLYILVGNHDYIQNQQFLTTNHWMNGLKEWPNVTVVDKVICKMSYGQKFVFCPYVPNGRFIEALGTLDVPWEDATCIFAHQEFFGCKMGAIISVDGDKWGADFPFVLSGHIHSNQWPQPNIYYCGSALQHAFGESEKSIIPVVSFENKENRNVKEFDLGIPKKKIIYTTLEDGVKNIKCDKYTKITFSGDDASEFKLFKKSLEYKQIIDSGAKVVFKTKQTKQKFVSESNHVEFTDVLYNICKDISGLPEIYNLLVNGIDEVIIN